MSKNTAIEQAIQRSTSQQSTYVVFKKGLGDYSICDRDVYNGNEELIVAEFCCGVRL